MIKYRIVYLGDEKYLAWDNDSRRFIPANMHLYVTTFDTFEECMKVARDVKRTHSGWNENIFVDSVERDPLGENRQEPKRYF